MESVESLVQLMPGCEVVLTVEEGFPESLPEGVNVELLRVLQEALANARRHSGALRLEVRLRRQEDDYVAAEVEDDGRGFDRKSVRAGVASRRCTRGSLAWAETSRLRTAPAKALGLR
jgi:signal transduction histidine kinase